jgi:hypothetical protein
MLGIRIVSVALATAIVTTLLMGLSVAAAPAGQQSSGVYSLANSSPVAGAWSTLLRTDSGIRMTLHTAQLDPGGAYTVWWIIFNNPAACQHGVEELGLRCSEGDLLPFGGDPAVTSSVLLATGHVIGNNGIGNFAAHLRVGQFTNDVLWGNGLLDPYGAEIHLIVRSHGDPIPGLVTEQISTVNGGCDINDCASQQFAAYPAP